MNQKLSYVIVVLKYSNKNNLTTDNYLHCYYEFKTLSAYQRSLDFLKKLGCVDLLHSINFIYPGETNGQN